METEELVSISITKSAFEAIGAAAAMRKRSIPQALDDLLAERTAMREQMFQRAEEAMKRSQQQAMLDGTSEMTIEEIIEEIAQGRREKRQTYTLAKTG
jgi:hypothetical protein